MINIANPIYDAVFKFLMEDKRVAVIILSALLKKKVVEVEFRRHEYHNIARDEISIFRIDFGATVEEEDGSRHMVLIELQKTGMPTETLRFRQYLGVQYASRENILEDDPKGNAIPMVTIYILGHKVGELEEPVLYVRRSVYDYQGRVITKGLPDPFIESITHDSIIVQIPFLKGRVSNRLETVLSIFDQSRRTVNEHILSFDDTPYLSDPEMERIISRLTAAAADSKTRHDMNVEDEYFSLIEERDTTILEQNKELAEKGAQLKEMNEQLKEKDGQLKEKDGQLKEKDGQLKEKDGQLKEKDGQLKEKDGQLKEKDGQLKEKDVQLRKKDAVMAKLFRTLMESGMSVEDVAVLTGQDIDFIRAVLSADGD